MIITHIQGAGWVVRIPLKEATQVTAKPADEKLLISWKDPEDYYVKGELITQWINTTLVVNEDHVPQTVQDGEIVVVNTVRDKYSKTPYEFEIEEGKTYHFALFPMNQHHQYSDGLSFGSEGRFEITFSYDGETYTDYVNNGDLPTAPEVPNREDGREFDEFVPEITEATEDAEYVATYKHLIEYKDSDNESTFAEEQVKNGYDAQMSEVPVKESDPIMTYEFAYWVDEPVKVPTIRDDDFASELSVSLYDVTSEKMESDSVTYGNITPEGEILDSWAGIAKAVDDGVYKDIYSIGNWKSVNYGETYGEDVPMEIVAFDADEQENGEQAPITWISKDCLKGTYQWNPKDNNAGGYPSSALKSTIEAAYNSIVGSDSPKPYVIPVIKTYRMGKNDDGGTNSTSFSVWTPSVREISQSQNNITNYIETSGPIYSGKFTGPNSCIKYANGTNTVDQWWLRSAFYNNPNVAIIVFENGSWSHGYCSDVGGAVLSFCTGGTPSISSKPSPTTKLNSVSEDVTVYPYFESSPREYTITWDDGETQVTESLPYGSIPARDVTPKEGFIGHWEPTPYPVNKDQTYVAVYEKDYEIHDSYYEINKALGDGSYKEKYPVGSYITVDLKDFGPVVFEVVAQDRDIMTDTKTTAPITLMAKNCIQESGFAYDHSGDKTLSALPVDLQKIIVAVDKYSFARLSSPDEYSTIEKSLKIFNPSIKELFNGDDLKGNVSDIEKFPNYFPVNAISYSDYLNNDEKRNRPVILKGGNPPENIYQQGIATYRLRDEWRDATNGYDGDNYGVITNWNTEDVFSEISASSNAKLICFCLSYNPLVDAVDPETHEINLSWDEIATLVDNGIYKDVLSVGDWKNVDFGDTYGNNVPVEIVAFDLDENTNGGNAPITWITKDTLKGTYQWNTSASNTGGYPQSNLKTIVDSAGASITGTDVPVLYIISVNKTYKMGDEESGITNYGSFTYWSPSAYELWGNTYNVESSGVYYSHKFLDSESRKKIESESSSRVNWWLRSAILNLAGVMVDNFGTYSNTMTNMKQRVVLGFCTGGHPKMLGPADQEMLPQG